MTLLEVAIGMTILTITAFSVLAGLLHGRRTAERALLEETALLYAQSYLEELRGTPYSNLVTASAGGTITTLVPSRVIRTNNVALSTSFDNRGTTTAAGDDMVITLTPIITKTPDIDPINRPIAAHNLQVTYSWTYNGIPSPTARTLRVIRSGFVSY